MPEISANLSMPYLMPAQAQKHVTHNEALRVLDALVQLSVESRVLTVPPALPPEGGRYLVASGASGPWAGQEGQIALYEAGGWQFLTPRPGWLLHDRATGDMLVFDGSTWAALRAATDQLAGLGVNTAADPVNRLSVAAPATLLSHEGQGHQLKINKATPGDTASLLYQSNWSGRAEMGLAGHDDFALKVSADGSSWTEALRVTAATGRVELPHGAAIAGPVTGDAVTQGSADTTPGRLIRSEDGYVRAAVVGPVSQSGGVPTGALIEEGENASGSYVRFADGTQICTHTMTTSASGGVLWAFPAVFITAPRVSALPTVTTPAFVTSSGSGSGGGRTLNGWDANGNRLSFSIDVTATGRWF